MRSIFPTQATGKHFNLAGQSLSKITIIILEKVKKTDESYRKEREKVLMRTIYTFYRGINRQPLVGLKSFIN